MYKINKLFENNKSKKYNKIIRQREHIIQLDILKITLMLVKQHEYEFNKPYKPLGSPR